MLGGQRTNATKEESGDIFQEIHIEVFARHRLNNAIETATKRDLLIPQSANERVQQFTTLYQITATAEDLNKAE